jgi:hypothetical protein
MNRFYVGTRAVSCIPARYAGVCRFSARMWTRSCTAAAASGRNVIAFHRLDETFGHAIARRATYGRRQRLETDVRRERVSSFVNLTQAVIAESLPNHLLLLIRRQAPLVAQASSTVRLIRYSC